MRRRNDDDGSFWTRRFFFILFFVVWRFFFSLSLTNKYPSPFSSGTLFVLWCALVFDSKVANRDFPGSLVHLNVTSVFLGEFSERSVASYGTQKNTLSLLIFLYLFFFRPFFLMSKRSTQKKSTTTTEEEEEEEEQQQRRDEKNARARPTRRRAPETLFY